MRVLRGTRSLTENGGVIRTPEASSTSDQTESYASLPSCAHGRVTWVAPWLRDSQWQTTCFSHITGREVLGRAVTITNTASVPLPLTGLLVPGVQNATDGISGHDG